MRGFVDVFASSSLGLRLVVVLFVLAEDDSVPYLNFLFCFIPCLVRRGLRFRLSAGVRQNRVDYLLSVRVNGVALSFYISTFYVWCYIYLFILFVLFDAVFFGNHPIPARFLADSFRGVPAAP